MSRDKNIVREPNSENCLHLIFAAPPCEKVILAPDPNYITSAIRKFRLDTVTPRKEEPKKLRTNRLFFKIVYPLDKNLCQAVSGKCS